MNLLEDIKSALPRWGPIGWMTILLALAVLFFSGISLFSRPDYEVLYSPSRILMTNSTDGGIWAFYNVEVGNTGIEPQDKVDLCLSRTAMNRRILPVTANNFGVTPRYIVTSNEQTRTIIKLGKLESEKRVEVSFVLSYPEGQEPDDWNTLFLGMELSEGSAKKGDPGMTMVGRAWFTIFGRVLPF